MASPKWEVSINADKVSAGFAGVEIAIVWSDYSHGFKSYGWSGSGKRILAASEHDSYFSDASFRDLIKMAEKICSLWNTFGISPKTFEQHEVEYDDDEQEEYEE